MRSSEQQLASLQIILHAKIVAAFSVGSNSALTDVCFKAGHLLDW